MDPLPSGLTDVLVGVGVMLGVSLLGWTFVRKARQRRRDLIEHAGEARSVEAPRRKTSLDLEDDGETEPEDAALPSVPTGGPAAARAPLPSPPEPAPPESPPRAEPPRPEPPRSERSAQVIPFPSRPAAQPQPKPAAAPAPPKPKRDTAALRAGLARTRSGWIARLGQVFAGKKEIDPALCDEIEKVLLTADIGVKTSTRLLDEIRSSLSKKEIADPEAVWAFLRRRAAQILTLEAGPVDFGSQKPFVLLVIGVNGSGKTTTIGKLAAKLAADGKKVLLAAGDTFRAAATEQLEIWAGRAQAALVRGKDGADPSSVIFDGVKKAKAEGFDVVIADTAGRLQTKTDLMEELQKVRRVIGKAAEGAPHETWLVVDATNGQNAISQAEVFTKAMAVSGIVLTKLDGTAKGGVVLGIAAEIGIPVRFVGVGEKVEDLRAFDPDDFVEALFESPEAAASPT